MDAGELTQLVTIQQKTITGTGDRGQPIYTWTILTQAYAKIAPLGTGKKSELARQLVADATHQITLRFLSTLTELMRIVDFAGTTYQIQNIQNVGHKFFFQTCLCTVQVNGQK